MKRLIEFPLGSSSSALVEVVAPEGAAPAERPEPASQTFEATFDRIKPIASTVVSRLRSLSDPPDELRVELGLKMSPAGLIVSAGSAEANFKVTLTWKR